jgi:endonuclease/exonuclease/phosphatase (EEP) superfamily protein YafD
MKVIRITLYLIALLTAFILVISCIGSLFCKYAQLSETSIIQVLGYTPFLWIIVIASVPLILFLLSGYLRTAIAFLLIMVIFAIFLDDISLTPVLHRKTEKTENFVSLKVGAYNVKYNSYGIEKISKFIFNSDIDILLLSENVVDTAKIEFLKNSLPAFSLFTDGGNDLSILSKYPIVSSEKIELPTYLASLSGGNDFEKLKENGVHRSFIHSIINVKGININILSLRLIAGRPKDRKLKDILNWGKYLVVAQNQELTVFLNYLRSLKGPIIFGGDLNTSPNSRIIHQIKKYVYDSWSDKHVFGTFTFKASFPTQRIDYIFHSKDLIVKKSFVVSTHLSDHFMVRSEFLIPRRAEE